MGVVLIYFCYTVFITLTFNGRCLCCHFGISVGIGAIVIGLSQIVSFFL